MKRLTHALCLLYRILLGLYPDSFHQAFAGEMVDVFAQVADDAAQSGPLALFSVWLRELRDGPAALLQAYRRTLAGGAPASWGGNLMNTERSASWKIDDGKTALLAALPPFVIGLGIAISAALGNAVGTRYWFDMPIWHQVATAIVGALPALAVGIVGLIALLRKLPPWGHAWVGGTLMGAAVLLNVVASELAESGGHLVSAGFEMALLLVLVLAGGVLLMLAALRSWAQSGLVSIGFVSLFGLSLCGMVQVAPFFRDDLALLAAPLGLLQTILAYLYVRRDQRMLRWGCLAAIWLLSIAPVFIAQRIWSPWLAQREQSSPLVPLLVIVSILVWAGPVAGLLGKPLRRGLGRS